MVPAWRNALQPQCIRHVSHDGGGNIRRYAFHAVCRIHGACAGIVWYDAAFVRKQLGQQAKALNILQQFEEFSERVGHSVLEVVGGILLGGVLTYFVLAYVA